MIASAALGAPIYLDHGVTGASGSTVWAGIRPEKIDMAPRDGESPPEQSGTPPGHNVVAGEIRHSAYLGSETIYEIALANGTIVKALRSNTRRYEERGFDNGDPVWLSWNARSPVVVLS